MDLTVGKVITKVPVTKSKSYFIHYVILNGPTMSTQQPASRGFFALTVLLCALWIRPPMSYYFHKIGNYNTYGT